MRLVRDDEYMELSEEQAENTPEAEDRATAPAPAEPPDGEVEDASADESGEESLESAVDGRVLEALLLSTHHPLTAGRLAELMDLPSTKPVRRAIKDLDGQYVEAHRGFRIEQGAGGYQILT